MLKVGDMVKGRYRVIKTLNEGGMGIVHLATDTATGSYCAVKEPNLDGRNDPYKLEKIKFEAAILQKLQHPKIVRYIDSQDTGSTFFLVIEYIQGENLGTACYGRPLTENKVEKYTLQMLDALDYLHRRNIIHRDISPENFMVHNDTITMIDLGTVREFYGFVNPGWTVVGKERYTPPEQWERGESILQSDIYALGRTMIFLLTGYPPTCPSGTIPPGCSVNDHMKTIVVKATQKIPTERYSSASEMKQALTQKVYPIPTVQVKRPRIIINGESHFLTRYTYVIGSGAADINIDDPHGYISRKHARITRDAFNQYWIEDGCDGYASSNGTYVLQNGKYVKKDKWALKEGDIIAFCYKEDKGPYVTLQYKET